MINLKDIKWNNKNKFWYHKMYSLDPFLIGKSRRKIRVKLKVFNKLSNDILQDINDVCKRKGFMRRLLNTK